MRKKIKHDQHREWDKRKIFVAEKINMIIMNPQSKKIKMNFPDCFEMFIITSIFMCIFMMLDQVNKRKSISEVFLLFSFDGNDNYSMFFQDVAYRHGCEG